MGANNRRRRIRCEHEYAVVQRNNLEAELAAIPPLDPKLSKIMSAEGFIDYYLRMVSLYPSNRLAYERLEEFYENLTGQRRYSDFKSFLIILDRYLKSIPKPKGKG